MICGTHWRTVDGKGRIGIPARWVSDLDGIPLMMTRTIVDSLVVIRQSDWYSALESVDASQRGAMIADSWAAVLSGCHIRYNRRLRLPQTALGLCGLAGGDEAVIVGRGRGFEVWSGAAWDRERDALLGALLTDHGYLSHPLIPWLVAPDPDMSGRGWYNPGLLPETDDAEAILSAKAAMPALMAAEARGR